MSKQKCRALLVFSSCLVWALNLSCAGNQTEEVLQDYQQNNYQQGDQQTGQQASQQAGQQSYQANQQQSNQQGYNNDSYANQAGSQDDYSNEYGDDYNQSTEGNSSAQDGNSFDAAETAPFKENGVSSDSESGDYDGQNLNLGDANSNSNLNSVSDDGYENGTGDSSNLNSDYAGDVSQTVDANNDGYGANSQQNTDDSEAVPDNVEDTIGADETLDAIPLRSLLTWVGYDYQIHQSKVSIEIITQGTPRYTMFQEVNQKGQPEVVIRLYETDILKKMRRDIDASEFRSPIAYIRMRGNIEEGASDVILTLRDNVLPKVFVENGNILLSVDIPEKYFGNNSLGSVDETFAEVISDAPIVTQFLEGSVFPEGIKPPDMTNGSFEDQENLEQEQMGEYSAGDSVGYEVGGQNYENGLPSQDFDNTEVVDQEANENYGSNVDYASNNTANTSNSSNQYDNYNDESGSQSNTYSNQEGGYDNQGNDYDNQGNDYGNQGNSQNQSNYNQQGNYNQQENYNDQDGYDNNENLDQNNIDDVDDEDGGDSEYNNEKFEVELFRKTGLKLVTIHHFVSVAQDDYDLADDGEVVDYGETNQNPTVNQNYGNTNLQYANKNANQQINNLENTTLNNQVGDAITDDTNYAPMAEGADQATEGYPNEQYLENGMGENPIYNTGEEYDPNTGNEYIDLTGDEAYGNEDPADMGGGDIIKPVRMEFKGAQLKDVIAILGEENNTNFIYKEAVLEGVAVNLSLKDVSWTDALRAVLETHGLGFVELPGGVVRIDKVDALKIEREDVRAAKKAARQLIPTKVLMVRLSYAKAEEVQKMLDTLLDKDLDARSRVTIDQRTNTLILEAVPEVLAQMKSVIRRVDTQTPQVKIEARIIEVSEDDTNSYGINWGTPLNLNAATGLGLGSLNFPNSVSSAFAVDTGAELLRGGKTRARLGSINDIVELDLSLQWEVTKTTTRILQNTSTIVMDNEKATIESGLQDFVEFILNGEAIVEEIDYFLKLDVTPQITSDGSVALEVEVETSDPKEAPAGVRARRSTKRVVTKLIRDSGETAVIGGVYTSQQDDVETGVPFLKDVPLIGVLFRSSVDALKKKEVIILITPTVLNGERVSTNATPVSGGSFAAGNDYGGEESYAPGEEGGTEVAQDVDGENYNGDDSNYDDEGENEQGYQNQNSYNEQGYQNQNSDNQQGDQNQNGNNQQGYQNQNGNNQQGYQNQNGNNQQGYQNQNGNNQSQQQY